MNLTESQINFIAFDKKESKLLTNLAQCRTRKCSKINKEKLKERKILDKEQDKQCPQNSSKAFYNCSVDIYNKSKYKTLFNKFVSCGEKKCSKERKTLKKYQKKLRKNIKKNMNS
jgi:hypothetical protein